MRNARPAIVLTLVSILIPAAIARGDQVDHPAYTNWSKFPVGTRVKVRSTTTTRGQVTSSVENTTVLVKKDDKAVVIRKSFQVAGEPVPHPDDYVETTIKRAFPLLPGVDKSKIGRPAGVNGTGQEKIEALGKTYDAEWYESRGATEAGPVTTRTWISPEMPGEVVKSVSEVKAVSKMTIDEVVEIVIPGSK